MSDDCGQDMRKWTVVRSTYLEKSRWVNWRIDICRLPDGSTVDDYHVAEFPPGVGIVALTPQLEVVLVRQYRHGEGRTLTEIPGGYVSPDDRTPLDAAQRELREETGYSSDRWVELANLAAHPASQEYPVYLFMALDSRCTSEQRLDQTEQIEVVRAPLDRVSNMIEKRQLQSLGSVAGVLLARERISAPDEGYEAGDSEAARSD